MRIIRIFTPPSEQFQHPGVICLETRVSDSFPYYKYKKNI